MYQTSTGIITWY